jgi:hypothetical protein
MTVLVEISLAYNTMKFQVTEILTLQYIGRCEDENGMMEKRM